MNDQNGPEAVFLAGLSAGRVRIQKCSGCERHVFYPRVLCPHCGADDLVWTDVGGAGTVYTTTTVRQKPEQGGDFNICIVELAEGIRMMSTITDIAPDDVRIGMPVRSWIGTVDGRAAVFFRPAEG